MITENDLLDLGYTKKQNSPFGKVKSADYVIENCGYVVNLTDDGIITVIVSNPNTKGINPIVNETNLNNFINWHNKYNNE